MLRLLTLLLLAAACARPDGHPLRDREVHLVSANPAVARVDPEDRVWPVAPGDVVVRAAIDDKEGEIAVHVR